MPKSLIKTALLSISLSFGVLLAGQFVAQAEVTQEEATPAPETAPNTGDIKVSPTIRRSRRNRVAPVEEGAFQDDREGIRNWLLQAKKRGVGIQGYLDVYNDMEDAVRSGESEEVIKGKLDRLIASIGDQYRESRQLQSPTRKVPKRGMSQSHNRGKVDLTFGKDRYWTPHEVKQSCEEAERQAILRMPPHLRGDLAALQDLRRQRDERENAIMRKNGFKDRGFTKNPYRFRNNGQFGAGDYGTYRWYNR